jgi:pyruvate formate-lyase activating enzyme-like uncharacterized protein
MNCLPSPSAVAVIGSVLCSGRFNVLSEPANRIESIRYKKARSYSELQNSATAIYKHLEVHYRLSFLFHKIN